MNKEKRMKKKEAKNLKRYRALIGENKTYEMTEEEKAAPITKEIGEMCRHRREKFWYAVLITINTGMILAVVIWFIINFKQNSSDFMDSCSEEYENFMEQVVYNEEDDTESDDAEAEESEDAEESEESEEKEPSFFDNTPTEVTILLGGLGTLITGYLGLYYFYAKYRANSVRVTEKNFPEIYHTIEDYASRLGIDVPKAYISQGGGILNAFSTFIFKRQWVQINAELVEVAYREHKDMDALNFAIAHEMAHIYFGHSTLHYKLPIWFSESLPIIGSVASRAREFSCDRMAQRLTGNDGLDTMLVLVIDRHLYKMLDKEDYVNEVVNQKGLFMWAYNLVLDHPVLPRRVEALVEGRGSGRLF